MISPQLIIPLGCLVALSSALPWNDQLDGPQGFNVNDGSSNGDCQSVGVRGREYAYTHLGEAGDVPVGCAKVLGAALPTVQDAKSSFLSLGLEQAVSQEGAGDISLDVSSSTGSHSNTVDNLGSTFQADYFVHLENFGLEDGSADASATKRPQGSSSLGEPSDEQFALGNGISTDERDSFGDRTNDVQSLGTQDVGDNTDNVAKDDADDDGDDDDSAGGGSNTDNDDNGDDDDDSDDISDGDNASDDNDADSDDNAVNDDDDDDDDDVDDDDDDNSDYNVNDEDNANDRDNTSNGDNASDDDNANIDDSVSDDDNADDDDGVDIDNSVNDDDGEDKEIELGSDLNRRKVDDTAVSDSSAVIPKPSSVPPGHTHHVDVDDDEGEE